MSLPNALEATSIGVTDEKSARIHVRALTQIKRVRESDCVDLIIRCRSQKVCRPYLLSR